MVIHIRTLKNAYIAFFNMMKVKTCCLLVIVYFYTLCVHFIVCNSKKKIIRMKVKINYETGIELVPIYDKVYLTTIIIVIEPD